MGFTRLKEQFFLDRFLEKKNCCWNEMIFKQKPLTQIYLSSFQDDFLIQVFEEMGSITILVLKQNI